jgi:hypothetical protein
LIDPLVPAGARAAFATYPFDESLLKRKAIVVEMFPWLTSEGAG